MERLRRSLVFFCGDALGLPRSTLPYPCRTRFSTNAVADVFRRSAPRWRWSAAHWPKHARLGPCECLHTVVVPFVACRYELPSFMRRAFATTDKRAVRRMHVNLFMVNSTHTRALHHAGFLGHVSGESQPGSRESRCGCPCVLSSLSLPQSITCTCTCTCTLCIASKRH